MFGLARNPNQAYASVGVETDVATASPVKLVIMLYDGAILALASARAAIEQGDIPTRGQKISKAIEIISDGLQSSLDHNAGGELADRLAALYDYMNSRLFYANANANTAAIDEVVALLTELKSAWEGINQP
ncbi:flagellar export chaperone FliS [Niveibacterium sp. SC-1]|uniref:flagellar export chaperone FliS n=1 Tax=Niveibacterium sp. SC-1 TaxID=3135646 RepID=UPI00311F1B4E